MPITYTYTHSWWYRRSLFIVRQAPSLATGCQQLLLASIIGCNVWSQELCGEPVPKKHVPATYAFSTSYNVRISMPLLNASSTRWWQGQLLGNQPLAILLWSFFSCGMLFECAGFWRHFEHRRFGKELGCVLDACLPAHTVLVLWRFSGFLFQTSCLNLSNSCCESRIERLSPISIFSLLGPRLKVEVTTWRERSILSAACRMDPMIRMRWRGIHVSRPRNFAWNLAAESDASVLPSFWHLWIQTIFEPDAMKFTS